MDISVVLPIYNERENLVPLLDEIAAALAADRQAVRDHRRRRRQPRRQPGHPPRRPRPSAPTCKAIFFRRNSGQSAAFDAGFQAASGTLVVTMDADRQNDPRDIPR